MRLILRLFIATALLTPLASYGIAPPWTAAGVTGSINPNNTWYEFDPGFAGTFPIPPSFSAGTELTWNKGGITFSPDARSASSTVVYNVTSPQAAPGWETLEMGYSGVTSGSSVTATLYQVNPNTGAKAALCSVGSPVGTTYQGCDFTTAMNFQTRAYFVEVTLSRNGNQFPQINYLKIK